MARFPMVVRSNIDGAVAYSRDFDCDVNTRAWLYENKPNQTPGRMPNFQQFAEHLSVDNILALPDSELKTELLVVKNGWKLSGHVVDANYPDNIKYKLTISKNEKAVATFDYSMGSAYYIGKDRHPIGPNARPRIVDRQNLYAPSPTVSNVLYCLYMDSTVPIFFNQFCDELGYSNDSILAKATHEACMKIMEKMMPYLPELEQMGVNQL